MDTGEQNLPETINHPIHLHRGRQTALVLSEYHRLKSGWSVLCLCDICFKDCEQGDFIYSCGEDGCRFKMHVECTPKAAISYDGHQHPLFFHELARLPGLPTRCCCCSGESSGLMYRCGGFFCDFKLHLSCGPLPLLIPYSHGGHEMNLTLTDSLLDGVGAGDCWCDVCEEQRDPTKCVYRSSDPPFTAAIDCILPQIARALTGELGVIKVRTVKDHLFGIVYPQHSTKQSQEAEKAEAEETSGIGDPAAGQIVGGEIKIEAAEARGVKYVTLSLETGEFEESLSEEDKEVLEEAGEEFERYTGHIILFRFSDVAFQQFEDHAVVKGEVKTPFPEALWITDDDLFVEDSDNLILVRLYPLYQQVIEKYGDFNAGCRLSSPKARVMYLTALLLIIKCMQTTLVFKVTDDLLCSWQWYLTVMSDALKFKTQPFLDGLQKLAQVFYALKLTEARDSATSDLNRQIEHLEREIALDKPRLEALEREHRRSKESAFVKKCLAEASALKWKNAGEFLGLDPEEESIAA